MWLANGRIYSMCLSSLFPLIQHSRKKPLVSLVEAARHPSELYPASFSVAAGQISFGPLSLAVSQPDAEGCCTSTGLTG